jgi:Uma2 family endonuclease
MNKPAMFPDSGSAKVRFTADEFVRLMFSDVFDDARLELIDGELFHMSPPSGDHARRQAGIIGALWSIARSVGLHLLGEVAIRTSTGSVLVCDAALARRLPADRSALLPADVLLVVEVAETTVSRDLSTKRIAYAQAGIPHYWVIDGARSVVHVFAEPKDGEFSAHGTVRFGEPLAVPGTDATITLD